MTRNLFEALQVFRLKDRPRDLWADAVCIDQENLSERSAQVQLMAQIFSGASRVLVWLGHGDYFSIQVAFHFVCRYVNRYGRDYLQPGESASYFWRDSERISHDSEVETGPSQTVGRCAVRALGQLFSCPYFRRGWVIQEVALPKVADVHWGHAQINIHWLGHVAYYLLDTLGHEFSDDLKAYDGLREFDSMYSILEQTQYNFIDRTFGRLLMETRGALFKDPRDRIYGMLGLRNSFNEQYVELKSVIQPDYEASLLDCYKATTDTLLVEHQDIIVLTLVQHRNDVEPDWPSYVPHYEQWLLEDLSYQSWRCSGNTSAVVSKAKDGLVLQEFRVDTITSVMGGYESSHSNVELQLLLRQLHAQFAPETVA